MIFFQQNLTARDTIMVNQAKIPRQVAKLMRNRIENWKVKPSAENTETPCRRK